MISLPPGFDYIIYIGNLLAFVMPFVVVSALFCGFHIILRAIGEGKR